MRSAFALLTLAAALCLPALAGVGDVKLGVIGDTGALVPVTITKTNSRAIGWNSSGVLGPITISGGSGSSAWADITGKPTTLAGYGIVDSITAALAASTYQPLSSNLTTFSGITPSANVQTLLGAANYAAFKASLSLGNVENTALSTWAGSTNVTTLGTVSAGTWNGSVIAPAYLGTGSSISAKFLRGDGTWQTVSATGGTWGTISGTLADQTDLQTALNAKLSSTLAASTYQPIITDGALSIARTSGLQDALDAKLSSTLAASSYQPLITDGSLSIARTSGLQAALDAKLSSTLAASTYQTIITDGSLSIARTSGLQAALDAKLSSTLAASTYQTIITDGSLTIARTSGLQAALDTKLSSTLAASTYQPLAARLTELSGIANARGVPYNSGSGLEGYLNFSSGGQPATDPAKLVQYNYEGDLNTGRNIYFSVPAAPSGYDTSTLSAPATLGYTWDLPAGSGTLARISDISLGALSGLGTGVATALAMNIGSAGAPVLYNGALGTPSGGNVTNCTVKDFYPAALSNESDALTTGLKLTFRIPYACTLSAVRIDVSTAPTGSVIIVDVKESGTTIFSTKPQIAVGDKTSVGGAVPGVISDTALAENAEITVFVDQIGSTIAGAGLKIVFILTR